MRHAAVYVGLMLSGTLLLAPEQSKYESMTRSVELKNARVENVGSLRLKETPNGVLISLNISNLPAGVHGFHIHETGQCEPPSFESAGGHFNPTGARHGFENPKGAHAGDLPNIYVPENGRVQLDVLARGVTLKPGSTSLLDADGSAVVVHSAADDYTTDPAGNAGSRLACGVIHKGTRQNMSK